MRKILTSTMIAGAALLVAACGGEAENNTAANNVGEPAVIDPMTPLDTNTMDGNVAGNDMNTVTTTVTTDGNVVDTNTTTE